MSSDLTLLVVGGGPAGVTAALQACELRRHGIDLVENLGPAGFVDPHTVAADGARSWSADRIILAVGGHAGRLRIPGADLALTYEDIPSLASFPRRVAVVGGADTG